MRTLLVIDDHLAILDTLSLILRGNGYTVISAATSAQAEQQFADNAIDLVIVDHGLPGISGSELARKLKQTKGVLVLMLTGNPNFDDYSDAIDIVLHKPVRVPELLQAIQGLLVEKKIA